MTDIKKLGDAVDEAEDDVNLVERDGWEASDRPYYDRLKAAKNAYFDALRKPWFDEQDRLERYKVRISKKRLDAAERENEIAARRLASFEGLEGWLYTDREYTEAEAAADVADRRFDLYYNQFWRAIHDADERKPKRRKSVLGGRCENEIREGVT